MKTQKALTLALNKYTEELGKIRERLDWTRTWLDAANFMQEPNLFVAQIKEKDDLLNREKEMEFKIRFTKWVLEDEQPKENENGQRKIETTVEGSREGSR